MHQIRNGFSSVLLCRNGIFFSFQLNETNLAVKIDGIFNEMLKKKKNNSALYWNQITTVTGHMKKKKNTLCNVCEKRFSHTDTQTHAFRSYRCRLCECFRLFLGDLFMDFNTHAHTHRPSVLESELRSSDPVRSFALNLILVQQPVMKLDCGEFVEFENKFQFWTFHWILRFFFLSAWFFVEFYSFSFDKNCRKNKFRSISNWND